MRYGVAIAAMLLAAPISLAAQTGGQMGTGPVRGSVAVPVTAAVEYVAAAAAGDLYEKTSSELVLRNEAGAPEVKRFAQKMVNDHQNLGTQLRTVADSLGVRPGVPTMSPQQQAMIAQLQAATGAQRDRVYLVQQGQAHREALALHQGYAAGGDQAALREVARMAAQVVEGHLMELDRVAGGN